MNFTLLHTLTQQIIDAIAHKQPLLAKEKVNEAQHLVNNLTDTAIRNEDLITLTKYQTLITMLSNKLK